MNIRNKTERAPNSCRRMFDRLINSLNSELAPNTVRQYSEALRELCECLEVPYLTEQAGARLLQVSNDDVVDYINRAKSRPAQAGRSALIGDKVSPVTIKKKLNCLTSVFRHLIKLGLTGSNPFKDTRDAYQHHKGGDRRVTKMIDFEVIRAILDRPAFGLLEARDKAIIAALVGGGLRRSEAAALRMSGVQEKQGHLYLLLRNTKAQRSALQFVLPWAAPYVRDYAALRTKEGAKGSDALFPAYTGRARSSNPITDTALYLIFKRYLKRHGVDETQYTPHSCRATVITLMLERGKSERIVQKFSRHQSVEMVAHYDKLRKADRPEDFEDVEL